MKTYQVLVYCVALVTFISCNSQSKTMYNEAYMAISNDFISKDISLKEFGKDVSGLYIYDLIYPYPLDKNDSSNFYKNILSEKEEIKPLREDKHLKELSNKYKNINWELNAQFNTIFKTVVQYQGVPNGPLNAAIFSEIHDNQLRIDVVPFLKEIPNIADQLPNTTLNLIKLKL
ncbi:hypothetical protein H5J24_10240 [Chryseobacterium capnotolerans]|uniref:hypothetical protein n=1 Tax=Chryseobacterium capnotolerans TaxID=2759528 RepID=UPI001E583EF6|nr:hypothetical protein [Chryseobacterium capnotolerans]UHO40323.1 hypothetical protein H5J24_10240 [Chryseobacterium capnotolerans]